MSRRKKETLTRREFLKATGIMAGSVLLSACSEYIQEIPTPTPTLTVSSTSTKTLTPTPTHTPESTATYTPTETPFPQIELPFTVDANNQIVLTPDGRARFAWETPMNQMPTVQEVGKQLNAEPWSPEFFEKWHRYMMNVSIQSVPLVKQFPQDMPKVEWNLAIHHEDRTDYQRDEYKLRGAIIYRKGYFPVRPIAIVRDDDIFEHDNVLFPMYFLTQHCCFPDGSSGLRDMVFTQIADDVYPRFANEGIYASITFNYPDTPSGIYGYDYVTMIVLSKIPLANGKPRYDRDMTTQKLLTGGIVDTYFDAHPNIGIWSALGVAP